MPWWDFHSNTSRLIICCTLSCFEKEMEGYSHASMSGHHGEYPWLTVLCATLVGLQSSPVLAGKAQPSVRQRCPSAWRAPPPQALVHPTVNNCSILSGCDCMLTVLPLKEGAI